MFSNQYAGAQVAAGELTFAEQSPHAAHEYGLVVANAAQCGMAALGCVCTALAQTLQDIVGLLASF